MNAEQMRGEFGDAVSRHGAERDELLAAIEGYEQRRRAAADRAGTTEEMMRAILSGGVPAVGTGR